MSGNYFSHFESGDYCDKEQIWPSSNHDLLSTINAQETFLEDFLVINEFLVIRNILKNVASILHVSI